MRLVALLCAVLGLGTARLARGFATDSRGADGMTRPYAPSPNAAPIVSLGYRELLADLLFARMLGYFGSQGNEASAIAELAEAIAALDPVFRRNYDVGPIAMTAAASGVDNNIHLRAIALLQRASEEFPSAFRYPNLAGQIYLVDLQTTDPALRRTWDEKGALLLESAARKPNAPADAGLQAAILQTRFGQQQRAIEKLRELILITDDKAAGEKLVAKLVELTNDEGSEIAAELFEGRRAFEREWLEKRPAVPATYYVLFGAPLGTTFDLAALATGHEVIGTHTFERLDPPTDPPTSEDGPSSP